MESFLLQFFIFLASAAIAVPVAKKLGLGSVLGYLIAGIIIGPFGVSLIHDVEDVMHFTEFGVVMMLFLVGLELKPSLLWKLRLPILGMGGAQVVITSLVISGVAFQFLPWQQALAIGLILSLSSTAIVLQTLKEKGQMDTGAGRSIFSVLLFQDMAVIPMLAGLPLLATLTMADGSYHGTALFDISAFPDYLRIFITLSAILFVLVAGKFACGPIFRMIASIGMREVFVAAALALVIGTSLLMLAVGLSPALGAFLAGVMLSDSEFRHELESDIYPFKGLLLGIFFISIGASLNFLLIGENIVLILGMTVGLMIVKAFILFSISYLFKINKKDLSLFTVALAQGGEFAFILFQFSRVNGVLPVDIIEPLISVAAVSMFLTPVLFIVHEKMSQRQIEEMYEQESDVIEQGDRKVILAGFGRLGTDVGRFLLSAGIKPVILDHHAANVSLLRKFGYEVYYGDATRLDLLDSAGANEAELLIVAIGDTERAKSLIELAQKHYPQLKIIVSAQDREAAFEVMDLDVNYINRETFGSALDLGKAALEQLGLDPYRVHRLSLIFKKKDEEIMPALYEIRSEKDTYISHYQEHLENLEKLMKLDDNEYIEAIDNAWTAKNPKI